MTLNPIKIYLQPLQLLCKFPRSFKILRERPGRMRYSTQSQPKLQSRPHIPVMAKEVVEHLKPSSGNTFIDMTFGAGGHTSRILSAAPNIRVFALDRDPVAHQLAQEMAQQYPGQVIPLLGRFSELPMLLANQQVQPNSIDGILFDFGCSSMQFDVAERGFSLSKDGPLDMRMDGNRFPEDPTAADVLERASEVELARIIKVYGEEKAAKRIARAIVDARYSFKKLETTWELARLVESVLGGELRTDQLGRFAHGATKTFQALRIFVNNEMNEINYAMIVAEKYLKINGRLIAISFHSLEDTIVKRHLVGNVTDDVANTSPLRYYNHGKVFEHAEVDKITQVPWKMLHKHVIVPSDEEIEENPRSRSAKFRAIIKIT
ncbi:probable methyltransferase-like protein 15 homolog [Fopius arisanus]|uniref:Probable methyltransferase-like protein 15 homolog n=1 Tax=Fopius arisanus TaxID=64838 RepID=A0A9R1U3U4_9HYME|nr:PREDICTED: probable methyltransferase-like protein 15 homolog [Fopius arisanus]